MSVRYEGADARYTSTYIAKAGEEIGEDTVPEGKVALVMSYDEVFYLVGTVEEIRRFLTGARMDLRLIEEEE